MPASPDADGKIVHEVQAYQALYTIAEAYHVPVDRILGLNGLQADWPLQIGQKLLISPGNVTPSPTQSNVQKLTPEGDGNYYHIVHSGETLSWIANWYQISLADLMAWNGLNAASVIRPEQKLVLQVTPPVTPTATQSPSPTAIPLSPSPSFTPSPTATPPLTTAGTQGRPGLGLMAVVGVIGVAGLLWWRFARKR